MRRRPPTVYIVLALIALIGFIAIDRLVPPQHLAWRSLDIDARTGAATDTQMFRLALSPSKTCAILIDRARDMQTMTAEPKTTNSTCGWKVARLFYGSNQSSLKPGEATMQCPLAVGAYIWTREIDQAAQKRLGSGLKYIHHAGTYSCRKQVGNNSGQISEHSFANAWDVTGFELEDGRIVSVLKGWKGTKDERKFLRDVRREACRIFRVTLSPDYNAAHKDHFHVDMGPTTACS